MMRLASTIAELDELPVDSVVLDDGWYPKVKGENNKWWTSDCDHGLSPDGIVLPTQVIWTPDDCDEL